MKIKNLSRYDTEITMTKNELEYILFNHPSVNSISIEVESTTLDTRGQEIEVQIDTRPRIQKRYSLIAKNYGIKIWFTHHLHRADKFLVILYIDRPYDQLWLAHSDFDKFIEEMCCGTCHTFAGALSESPIKKLCIVDDDSTITRTVERIETAHDIHTDNLKTTYELV